MRKAESKSFARQLWSYSIMPSRCVMVVGIPRAGTSMVAGILHKCGVDMGAGHFQNKDKANPRGYFEDLQWRYANQRVTGKGYSIQAANIEQVGKKQRGIWRSLVREYKTKPLWGMKDPWLCFVGQFIWPILKSEGVDVRVVFVHRDLDASTASIRAHVQKSYKGKYKVTPRQIATTWYDAFRLRRQEWGGAGYDVWYEDILENATEKIRWLVNFCYAGLTIPAMGIDLAVEYVTPRLNHHGR
jgi:hypothetical protein